MLQPPKQPDDSGDLLDIPFDSSELDELAGLSSQHDIAQARTESDLIGSGDYKRRNEEQQLLEKQQTHEIRKKHLGRLFYLTLCWIVVIWIVVVLQGFGQIPTKTNMFDLKFELSEAILIAFMTTTTTTVLGLYGIAAYWLYGAPKKSESSEKTP